MPEGHVIHRAAVAHNKWFARRLLEVSSPQKRFSQGAKVINGKQCIRVEAFGKHLFYHFDNAYCLHIHLGLFGRIKVHKAPLRAPRGKVRVRMVSATHIADINGPTICEIQNNAQFQKTISRIGPDLLRSEARPEEFVARVTKSKRTIGSLLMDQSVIAGIGNIFRIELLWRNRIHPETKGQELHKDQLLQLWKDGRELLSVALKTGKIMTRVKIQFPTPKKSENLNIYKKQTCPRCKNTIEIINIENRKCYFCAVCQSL